MTDGLARLLAQAVQAGFVPPRRDEIGAGHRQNMPGDTLDNAHVSRHVRNSARQNNEIGDPGHGDTQDARFCRDSPKHPKKANDQTSSASVVMHLGRGTGLPTHPATCTVCGKSDWLVNVRDDMDRTFHASCWREASDLNHDGD